jgi:GGDEF domain-containing protein
VLRPPLAGATAMRSQIDALTGLWNRAYLNQPLIEDVAA